MDFEVRCISSKETRSLRHRVLWPHLPSPEVCVIDIDERPDAFHVGVFHEQRLVSIGSFFAMTSPRLDFFPQYRLRAMATDPDYRRMHAGDRLIDFGLERLRSEGVRILWCDARLVAVPFYESLGFSAQPDVYEVPLIGPHHFMWKEL
ncbi:MAG: GNAT family N-acetyltransferase [Flavobacteriales bacterium]